MTFVAAATRLFSPNGSDTGGSIAFNLLISMSKASFIDVGGGLDGGDGAAVSHTVDAITVQTKMKMDNFTDMMRSVGPVVVLT